MQALAILMLMLICSDADIFQATGRYAAAVTNVQDADTVAAAKPLLQIWSMDRGCPGCDAMKRDIKAGKLHGVRIEWMEGSHPNGYPTITHDGKSWTGWSADRLATIRKATGLEARPSKPQPQPQPQPQKQTAVTMSWNINGDWSPTVSQTSKHLLGVHGVSTDGMTHQQMLDLHDSLHNGTKSQSSCPGGVCPPQTTTRRRGRLGGLFR